MAKYYVTACEEFYRDKSDSNRLVRTHLSKIQSICPQWVDMLSSDLSRQKQSRFVRLLNCIVCAILRNDTLPEAFSMSMVSMYEEDELKDILGNAFASADDFNWDVDFSDPVTESYNVVKYVKTKDKIVASQVAYDVATTDHSNKITSFDTFKETSSSINETPSSDGQGEFTGYRSTFQDINLDFRVFPIRDKSKLWDICYDDCGREMKIYHSYPIIPTKQNEITITTPYEDMSDSDLMKLFPDHFIRTRLDIMYEPQENFTVHPKLGFIPKITGFTEDQVIDNIIKYPRFSHIFRLVEDDNSYHNQKRIAFINRVEVDGELLSFKKAIRTVDDMKNLPDIHVFHFDYIMRRYLLERDYHTVEHKYPLDGYLQPFTVLFMTPEEYAEFGYTDSLDLARQCVKHRVQFYQSIHPLTRERYFPSNIPKSESIEKRDCVFAETCDKLRCDYTCGEDVMFNYILNKSGIQTIEDKYDEDVLIRDQKMLSEHHGNLVCVETNDVVGKTREFVYIYACKLRGTKANVVHISYSSYIQQIRDSWTYGGTEDLEHIQVRLRKWTVAVISGIDYCMFKDFESQTLLNIIESRRMEGLTTIILTRSLTNIHGNSVFLSPLKEQLKEVLVHDRIN